MNYYIARFTARCPNKNAVDNYKVTIKQKGFMQIEDLVAYLNGFKDVEVFQEDLNKLIAKRFLGAKVMIVGDHQGVKIKSVRKYDRITKYKK